VIPLILDGENAWETFTDGGQSFLRELYSGILNDKQLNTATMEQYLRAEPPTKTVRPLHTGSWISCNFDIWIGEDEENRGWDLLGDTRKFLQTHLDSGKLSAETKEAALHEIYAAEGSDWFWWYGPDFSTENDALFDDLFRQHLKNVYALCGELPPSSLEEPITAMRVAPLYHKPERPVSRVLSGRRSSFFDWMGAGSYVAGSEQGAMYRSERIVRQFFFGNNSEFLFLRLDLARKEGITLRIEFHGAAAAAIELSPQPDSKPRSYRLISNAGVAEDIVRLAVGDVAELAVPLEKLGLSGDSLIRFQVKAFQAGLERECYPERVPIEFAPTRKDYALEHWML
jgi:hypothetical protein